MAYLSGRHTQALKNDLLTDLVKTTTVMRMDHPVTIADESLQERKVSPVDSTFLELFSFPLLRGNKNYRLKDPSSILLTESPQINILVWRRCQGKTH